MKKIMVHSVLLSTMVMALTFGSFEKIFQYHVVALPYLDLVFELGRNGTHASYPVGVPVCQWMDMIVTVVVIVERAQSLSNAIIYVHIHDIHDMHAIDMSTQIIGNVRYAFDEISVHVHF